jgi:ribosomal protein S18 acetylase RimI-like enzyme
MSEITIAPASTEDAARVAALHVASKKEGYAAFMRDDYIQSLKPEEFTKNWTEWLADSTKVLIAADGENDAGFIAFGPIRTRLKEDRGIMPSWPGEIYALYVHPDYWGQGVANALMREASVPMRKNYWDKALLWVIDQNKRAVKFYEKMGGQRAGKQKVTVGDQEVTEIAFGWKDITKLG